jgi:CRP-like cAMP-binding protein
VVQSAHSANHLLASLGAENTAALLPHLKVLDLPQETVLFETGDTIETVYFPLSGVVSVVVDLANGEMIEAAMIGRDSLLGGSAAFDNQISLNRVVVQVAGTAAALNVNRIRELAQQSELFRAKLARHEQFLLAQAQQSAACNATHILEARLCRWLLRCHDLLESDDIPFTQEFLAEMLGVRRTSVTLVAKALQNSGLIRYRRGHIKLLDLEGVRESACECYGTIKAHAGRLLGTTSPEAGLNSPINFPPTSGTGQTVRRWA